MSEMHQIIGSIVTLFGSIFLFLGALGVFRMPDVYNRMQAGTKATTLGSMLFLLGIGIAHPHWLGKIILLVLFIIFTNPVSSHALARAAHFAGTKLSPKTVNDCLRTDKIENKDDDDDDIGYKERC
ncbi:MAG: monovalent cation/H(+) antiporter subunit G [Candidatus Zixiibacteriota bacterium]